MTGPLTLKRFKLTDDATLGQLFMDGRQLCLTCELPWDRNLPGESCIPAGSYRVVPHDSPAHPHTWEITGVPGRCGILIHNGNAAELDSEGCILVGDSYGLLEGHTAVFNSVKTLNQLRGILPGNFNLIIT